MLRLEESHVPPKKYDQEGRNCSQCIVKHVLGLILALQMLDLQIFITDGDSFH